MMQPFFKANQTILFQGDSVTDCGRNRSDLNSLGDGYAAKVAGIYNTLFPDSGVRFINKGVSGDRTCDLLARYAEDFKAIRPDFLSILIGINDTWRRFDSHDPTTTAQFEARYRQLLTQVKADLPDCKIMIIEPFLLNSDQSKSCFREDLDPKIQVVRNLAAEFGDYFLPMDGFLNAAAATDSTPVRIAADGVHPTQEGHAYVACHILKALSVI